MKQKVTRFVDRHPFLRFSLSTCPPTTDPSFSYSFLTPPMTVATHSREATINYLSAKFSRVNEAICDRDVDVQSKGKKRALPRDAETNRNNRAKRVDVDGREKENGLSSRKKTVSRKKPKSDYFIPPTGEVVEDENLELLGEQQDEDYDSDGVTLPMRTLDNFVFYNAYDNNRYCSIDQINDMDSNVVGSGEVAPIFVDDDDEEEGDDDSDNGNLPNAIPVQLSAILRWELCAGEKDDIPELWLLTCFGWYKLLKPAPH
ncbi:hypothetical protein BX666DRAFT_1536579 [Dichotomocladium elegans]|nr:hypothetical protein BX666DRAFT_1536579 [Dichotomocladium elegans]